MKLALTSDNWLKIALPVGALALVGVGCSAEASMPAPQKSGSNNGKGGSLNAGTGGTTGNPATGGTTGNPSATGGTTGNPSGTGGTTPATGGSAPATGGTSATGTGGGGALAACPSPPAAGAIADLLIDDLEDKDNGLAKVGNRTGFWYTYLDAFGSTITPAPDATGVAPLKPGSTDCNGGSTSCVLISGTTAMADEAAMKYPYAGVGFDFSNAKKPCVYNATAYTGIKFFARGDVPIRVKVNTSGTADPGGGGTCATNCNDGYGLDTVLTPTWTQVDLPFASLAQEGWGTVVTFDKAALLSVQIQIPAGQTFSAAFDDFTFY